MKAPLLLPALGFLWLATAFPAAAEPAYLDDRSSAEALLRSLYNAINRKEYARAYAYFDPPPAETLEDFAAGFADTESVELEIGPASSEGAAGSILHSVPVAILAHKTDGGEEMFAGCYDLRLVQPSVQTTPYRPLLIEAGRLRPAEGLLEDALPASCGDGAPADPAAVLLDKAERLFADLYGETCRPDLGAEEAPEVHTIRFSYSYEPESAPDKEATLFRFFCDRGAYNEVHAYLVANERGELQPLHFATPELDIRYENGDTDRAVEEIRIVGYGTDDLLVNSWYDEQERSISSHAKWRGVGDASSNGLWIFRDGEFGLVRYEADASYDGEINPELLLDYHTGP